MKSRFFWSLIFVFITYIFINIISIFFECRSIGASIQSSSLKVLLSQRVLPNNEWVNVFFMEVNQLSDNDKNRKIDFYYSMAVLGGEYFKYDAESEAVFYSNLDYGDRLELYNKLNKYIITNNFEKRTFSEKNYIKHRAKILERSIK